MKHKLTQRDRIRALVLRPLAQLPKPVVRRVPAAQADGPRSTCEERHGDHDCRHGACDR